MQRALMRANPATLTATGVVGRLERFRDVWLPDTLAAWFRLFCNPATLTATGVVGRLERLRDVWLSDTLAAQFRLFWGRGWMVPSRPDTNLWLISPRTATPSFPPPHPPPSRHPGTHRQAC